MIFKNCYALAVTGFISFSCHAHLSPSQVAELLRKKYIHECEISQESQNIIEMNHDLLIPMLESRDIHKEVIEFLDAMAFLRAKDGKPHGVYSKAFADNITDESNRIEEETAQVFEYCKNRSEESSKYERHIQKQVNEGLAQEYAKAVWKSLVAQYAFQVFQKAIIQKGSRNGQSN